MNEATPVVVGTLPSRFLHRDMQIGQGLPNCPRQAVNYLVSPGLFSSLTTG